MLSPCVDVYLCIFLLALCLHKQSPPRPSLPPRAAPKGLENLIVPNVAQVALTSVSQDLSFINGRAEAGYPLAENKVKPGHCRDNRQHCCHGVTCRDRTYQVAPNTPTRHTGPRYTHKPHTGPKHAQRHTQAPYTYKTHKGPNTQYKQHTGSKQTHTHKTHMAPNIHTHTDTHSPPTRYTQPDTNCIYKVFTEHASLNCDFSPIAELSSYKNKTSCQLWNKACGSFPAVL